METIKQSCTSTTSFLEPKRFDEPKTIRLAMLTCSRIPERLVVEKCNGFQWNTLDGEIERFGEVY